MNAFPRPPALSDLRYTGPEFARKRNCRRSSRLKQALASILEDSMLRRSRARLFGILALAAIALQMVLSLGHTHAGAVHLTGLDAAVADCFDNTRAFCPAPALPPADHDQSEAQCLICLAAHQAAAAVPPTSPEIAQPYRMTTALKPFVSAPPRVRTGAANFYARGPPAA